MMSLMRHKTKYSHGERCLLLFTPDSNAEAMPDKGSQPCLSDSILLEMINLYGNFHMVSFFIPFPFHI